MERSGIGCGQWKVDLHLKPGRYEYRFVVDGNWTDDPFGGTFVANPFGAIWSAALLLEHTGHDEEAARVMAALEAVAREGPRTRDVGGSAGTREVGEAVAARVAV